MNLTPKYKAGRFTFNTGSGDLVFQLTPFFEGAQGKPGPGVPEGGAAGQVLAKSADGDHATEWVDPPSGGGGAVPLPTVGVFENATDQEPSALVESNPVVVTGDADAVWPVRAVGGELSLDGETWHPWAAMKSGDQVRLRQTSSPIALTNTEATLHFPGGSQTWSVTTSDLFNPLTLPVPVGWFDISQTSSAQIEADAVLRMDNYVPGMRPVVAGAGGGPVYTPTGAPGGLPAIQWPNSGNSLSLRLDDDGAEFAAPVRHLFMVCQLGNGTQGHFSFFTSIFGNNVNAADGTAYISKNSSSLSYGVEVRINGAQPNAKVLPLPLSVLEFRAGDGTLPDPFYISRIGQGLSYGGRNFSGLMCEILAYAGQLSDQQVADVNAYLSEKWGLGE